ncbi:DNA/RNA nuclease SfsA [Shewanella sp. 202IG2-18]|uniref:DNA/RNA nuclease SfsA n=1 Tax=Parashewanella hymeniacidonis TaxID=2807618 RepID=UPI0019621920|nr:DNA/RNA nuclease SfsA [Parashewanella hymeniacidonis]MBM7071491.1 DNA/RNA nuclease SfsA [Parashewanella hymeniacidonis]
MEFSPKLQSGKLLKRYKRFLTDIELADGEVVTIHCPNTGSMKNCQFPEHKVWFSTSDNPKRKYSRTWELMETPEGHLIGVNTGKANHLAVEAIEAGVIKELANYSKMRKEVKYGSENSRIDILLSAADKPDCFIEVKSCTLLEDGKGYFPDAVTTRGQKHLRELAEVALSGNRAVLLFIVQHSGIRQVSPATHIDPKYSELLKEAIEKGVEVLAYGAEISPQMITIKNKCTVVL